MEDWKIGRLEGWKIGWLEGWKIGWLEGWKIGRLEDWKVGRLEGWMNERLGDRAFGDTEKWRNGVTINYHSLQPITAKPFSIRREHDWKVGRLEDWMNERLGDRAFDDTEKWRNCVTINYNSLLPITAKPFYAKPITQSQLRKANYAKPIMRSQLRKANYAKPITQSQLRKANYAKPNYATKESLLQRISSNSNFNCKI